MQFGLLILLLTAIAFAAPPRPVTYNWREAGEYPFHNGIQTVTKYRDAGLRIAQPGTGSALSDGDIRTPEQWLWLVAANWLRDDSNHVLDGNLYRDGVVNMTDLAVVARWWNGPPQKRDYDRSEIQSSRDLKETETEATMLDALVRVAEEWMDE